MALYVSHRFELGYNFARYPDWKLMNEFRHHRDVWSRYDVNDQQHQRLGADDL